MTHHLQIVTDCIPSDANSAHRNDSKPANSDGLVTGCTPIYERVTDSDGLLEFNWRSFFSQGEQAKTRHYPSPVTICQNEEPAALLTEAESPPQAPVAPASGAASGLVHISVAIREWQDGILCRDVYTPALAYDEADRLHARGEVTAKGRDGLRGYADGKVSSHD